MGPLGIVVGVGSRIAVGADHAYKEAIRAHLEAAGHAVEDFGTTGTEACDYPDIVHPVAEAVAAGRFERGIVLGGSGNGEAMAANRHRGIRCALCWNPESARLGRAHNDANMIALGRRMMPLETALEIVDLFLATPFEAGRHASRIAKIDEGAAASRG